MRSLGDYTECLKCEIRSRSYGIPGWYHHRLDVGYGVDVCKGECSRYVLIYDTRRLPRS
jgi:hypothetical protein